MLASSSRWSIALVAHIGISVRCSARRPRVTLLGCGSAQKAERELTAIVAAERLNRQRQTGLVDFVRTLTRK